MDAKTREQLLWLGAWAVVVAVVAVLRFRARGSRAGPPFAFFVAFAIAGGLVALVLAPIVAGARPSRSAEPGRRG